MLRLGSHPATSDTLVDVRQGDDSLDHPPDEPRQAPRNTLTGVKVAMAFRQGYLLFLYPTPFESAVKLTTKARSRWCPLNLWRAASTNQTVKWRPVSALAGSLSGAMHRAGPADQTRATMREKTLPFQK